MKRFLLLVTTSLIMVCGFAQKPGKTYHMLIRDEWIPTKKEYFQKLDEFLSIPDSATLSDMADLYYGYAYLKNYKGNADKTHLRSEKYFTEGNYSKALHEAFKGFRKNPSSLRNLRMLVFSGLMLNDEAVDSIKPYFILYNGYLHAIGLDKSGTSCDTAHRVLMFDDIVVYMMERIKSAEYEAFNTETELCYKINYTSEQEPDGDVIYFTTVVADGIGKKR